jgi:hypothetical protein
MEMSEKCQKPDYVQVMNNDNQNHLVNVNFEWSPENFRDESLATRPQITYAVNLIARCNNQGLPCMGDAFPFPTEEQLYEMSRQEASDVIKLLRSDLNMEEN